MTETRVLPRLSHFPRLLPARSAPTRHTSDGMPSYSGAQIMLLRVGCEISFDLPAPSAMVLLLQLHPSMVARSRMSERFQIRPAVRSFEYLDLYGNRCS